METPRHGPHEEALTAADRPQQPTLADLWVRPSGDGSGEVDRSASAGTPTAAVPAGPARHPAARWQSHLAARAEPTPAAADSIARQQQQIRALQREWRGLHDQTARAQRQRAALSRVRRRRQRMDEHQRAQWVQLRRQLKVIRGGR
jgi:hypothetical protein